MYVYMYVCIYIYIYIVLGLRGDRVPASTRSLLVIIIIVLPSVSQQYILGFNPMCSLNILSIMFIFEFIVIIITITITIIVISIVVIIINYRHVLNPLTKKKPNT